MKLKILKTENDIITALMHNIEKEQILINETPNANVFSKE